MRRRTSGRRRPGTRAATLLLGFGLALVNPFAWDSLAHAAPPPARGADPEPAGPEPHPLMFEVAVGGGAVLPWGAASELGHAFYGSVGAAWGPWRVSVAAGGAAPDSMARATFPAVWVEATWEALGRLGPLSPFVLAGAGVALGDGLSDPRRGEVRWSRGGVQPLVMVGVGVAFRPTPRGLFLAVDGRLFNHTHGGATLSAGARF